MIEPKIESKSVLVEKFIKIQSSLRQLYPDGWLSTAFQAAIQPIIDQTLAQWRADGHSDRDFFETFVKNDFIRFEFAGIDIEEDWMEELIPDYPESFVESDPDAPNADPEALRDFAQNMKDPFNGVDILHEIRKRQRKSDLN